MNHLSTPQAKFDGLAGDYDRARPRYPAELFQHAVASLPADRRLTVVDAGAGTGIALEGLLPQLPAGTEVHAVDISTDMIRIGREKFPQVIWHQGTAEDHLGTWPAGSVDLVVAAQSYQWMNREAYVREAARCLNPAGVCLVVQNNRDHAAGGFASAYEDLLEELSPGYSRTYRSFDIAGELSAAFAQVERRDCRWHQTLTVEEFVTMSSSSTQAQRAVGAVGSVFFDRVRELCARYEDDGRIRLPYVSEAFYAVRPR
ncbi:class I SAM-dependent methyltransferase [Streptomyces thermoviolaceus]|uniref:class I SAM-dependent methyltransferase n=1 Tax=Streptomyces thermoviolaceus TaxID=1952 RepID=UPI0019CB1271|nr:class I SAM-dependent methyltransferase [Streptomyces thermoviolaceus]MCM3263328.1 class I SAM-dependent methyltransferase [Streptomyces thermoviolaceus]GGV71567.1 methyltransferase [Streptomyces thermoviolaceus subsp. apingens]GHA84241.1 methyltransferase [Streptomyces thermoviolaceus subsp. thermoviolaceus]